ncbi:fibronectin type III domain-containing protein [Paenibacillus contaminans]|uniref:Fibronectin type-III domain-containing protein n=1 Tax=Paenibacillus contaminans TaxID=450362 RepID=A0A329M1H2_9BACL|nr:fibronectin type III domain-containing protein [Paenibacillus contaminans]RAV13608.1 hypothetical protein DQG23_32980 [Paenibacillus contaminans]
MGMIRMSTWKDLVLAVVLASSCVLGIARPASAYGSAASWKTSFDNLLALGDTPTYHYGYTDLADDAFLAQNGNYTLAALRRMYEVTGQTSYLQKLSTYTDNMFSHIGDVDGDGFLGWGSTYYSPTNQYEEYLLHRGAMVYEFAKFIQLVRADSSIAGATNPQGITYGSQANAMETLINSDLIPAFDNSWSNQYNVYLDNLHAGLSLPYNQYLAMASAQLEMAKLDLDAHKHYLTWADGMTAKWHYWLTLDGTGYHWNYWDRLTPADNHTVRLEDWSHTTIDFMHALTDYTRGGKFNTAAMTRLANTIYNNMWNGSTTAPKLSYYVNGSGSYTGQFTLQIGDMERWKPGIWALFEKEMSLRSLSTFSARSLNDIAILYQLHPDHGTPGSFSLASPGNGATGRNLDLAFSWTPSVNAADYTLQVSTVSNFATLTAEVPKIIGTSAMLTGSVLSPNTTYFWRVIARNGAGTTTTSGSNSFTTGSNKTYTLTFAHRDNRTGGLAGYHYKQLLIDGTVVWEKDVTADAANTWLTESIDVTSYLSGKSSVDVKLRLYEKKAVSNYTVDVYWDSVAITNTEIMNSGFETSPDWYYTESNPNFLGGFSSTAHSGTKALSMSLPVNIPTVIGDHSSVSQKISVIR